MEVNVSHLMSSFITMQSWAFFNLLKSFGFEVLQNNSVNNELKKDCSPSTSVNRKRWKNPSVSSITGSFRAKLEE